MVYKFIQRKKPFSSSFLSLFLLSGLAAMVSVLSVNLAYGQEENKEVIASTINNECESKYDSLQDMKNAIPFLEKVVATGSPETNIVFEVAQCVLENLKIYGELSNGQEKASDNITYGQSVYDKACGTNIPNNGKAKEFLTIWNNMWGPDAEEATPLLKGMYDCVNEIYEEQTGNDILTQLDDQYIGMDPFTAAYQKDVNDAGGIDDDGDGEGFDDEDDTDPNVQ